MAKKLSLQAKQRAVLAKEKEVVKKELAVIAKQLTATAKQMAVIAEEREDFRRKLAVTAEKLSLQAKQRAVTAEEREVIRKGSAVTAKHLTATVRQMAVSDKKKEVIRKELAVTAKQLAVTAKQFADTANEKEVIRKKLAVTAKQMAVTAKEREDVRRKLAVTAEKLSLQAKQRAVTANEKEVIRKELAVTAKQLAVTAKQLAVTAKQFAVTANEKEVIRKKLAVTAKHLAVIAMEREDVRRKLAVTAEKLSLQAKQRAVTANEKEVIRKELAVTAKQLVVTAKQFAVTAKGKENVRRKLREVIRKELAVTAKQLAVTAKQMAVTAKEKENVRRKLAVTAEKLSFQAIHLAESIEDVQNKNARLSSIVETCLTFGQNLGRSDLLNLIVESASSLLGARYAALRLLDGKHQGLAQFATFGLSNEEKAAIGGLPEGVGLLGSVIDDQRTLRLAHMWDDPRSVGFPPHHPRMESFLGVPIVIQGEVIGALYFTDKVGGPFTAEDEFFANTFALQVAVALESMTDHEGAIQLVKMLESMRKIEHSIDKGLEIQETLNILCVSLGAMFDVDRVIIRTFDIENHDLLNAQWYLPDLQPVLDRQIEQLADVSNLTDELWNSSSVLVRDDYLAPDAQADENAQKFRQLTGARSAILAPIGLDQRVLGIIYVITVDQPRHWGESEIGILKEVATFATQSIVEHGYRLQQQKYIARQEGLDRQKTNFVSTVSHELRTPLTSITGYLELLKDGVAGDITSEQRDMLEVIDRNSIRLGALIENLLAVNRSEVIDLGVDSVQISISELVDSTCQEFLPLAQSRAIQFEINMSPDAMIVIGDRGQIHNAVANIVSNAIKFSHVGGVVTISSSLNNETGMIRIICQDHGVGIPIEDQENLFTQFFRASNATDLQIPGTGLGLAIVKQIIHEHGGQVRLTSAEGMGTTVVVDLPLASVEVVPNLQ